MGIGATFSGTAFAADTTIRATTVARGLDSPWAVAFLPGAQYLVTERPGTMRLVAADGKVGPPLAGVPPVAAAGQGGLLDVVTDKDFAHNRQIFFCYSEPGEGSSNGTALASALLSRKQDTLEDVKVIFRQQPKVDSGSHFGCRIVEAPDGNLWLTLGERYSRRNDAQKLDNHLGKIVRIAKDGSVPKGNPFVNRPGALPEIWSYGHRNIQGAVIGPDSRLWTHEHGPQGGDEINLPMAGRNYGWPVITFGENYGGGKIGAGITAQEGMEQPLHHWTPSIAPSGMTFLTSLRYGNAWRGNLFVGSLKFRYLDRIVLASGKVQSEQKLLTDVNERIRDVRQGPDGLLYVLTDSPQGRLLRLDPQR
ncbi:PQQ-dependent sugar dehydrogenase [Xylophilus sp. GOD-11R]|nr:PQQ-dependent sugar dehydrogenase [Xylophilus sp. GOD-11R]WPB59398.1 PQQ-dependent sugar dehydrogenase [Xylophilus sp. GOD-11R]